jgi:hypothetical protein
MAVTTWYLSVETKSYGAAVAVLTELHHWRALALGEDAEETKLNYRS